MAEESSMVYMYHSFLRHSSADGHLGCFHVLAIINSAEFLKRWKYQTALPPSWETCLQVKKQQLEVDVEQHTGSKLESEYIKAVYCHPAYLAYMQNTSCEMPVWT